MTTPATHEDCGRRDCSDKNLERRCGHFALDEVGVPRVVDGASDTAISGLAERIKWLAENGAQSGGAS